MSKILNMALLAGAVAMTAPAFAKSAVMVGGQEMFASKNIVENAVNSADHTTLVAAVKAAGLVDTLSGKGPFTVFAPVNTAFSALPAGTVEELLKPENKAKLARILTYHVVSGAVYAKDVVKLHEANTVAGAPVKIDAHSGVKINGATVIKADIKTSNGVIHVIDTVLMPPPAH